MIDFDFVEWDDLDDPHGNVAHIARHGVTPDEVEEILYSPFATETVSESTGLPALLGRTDSGRELFVVYEISTEGGVTVVRPKTAYDV